MTGRAEISWTQPFRWGGLLAFDADNDWELPDQLGSATVVASPSCLAVPVRHVHDVELPEGWPDDLGTPPALVRVVIVFTEAPTGSPVHFDGEIACRSGRLNVGDAEVERVVDVPPGRVRVQVTLFPADHADVVVLRILPPR